MIQFPEYEIQVNGEKYDSRDQVFDVKGLIGILLQDSKRIEGDVISIIIHKEKDAVDTLKPTGELYSLFGIYKDLQKIPVDDDTHDPYVALQVKLEEHIANCLYETFPNYDHQEVWEHFSKTYLESDDWC